MKTAQCNSCGAEIIWSITNASGARMPLDAAPVDVLDAPTRGLFVLVKRLGDTPLAWSVSPDEEGLKTFRVREVALYVSHFSSCPAARAHRSPRPLADAIEQRVA